MQLRSSIYLTGVFDVLHQGHLNLLYKASILGNLEVGVVKDAAVKKQKGEDRPIINEETRLRTISALKYVYNAFLIDDFEIPEHILASNHLILIGEDQSHLKNLDKIPFMRLYILPRTKGISTSDIVKRLEKK